MAMKGEQILKSISKKTETSEFYTPVPKGYKPGKTKYVIVTGSVMSGLGKGIFSASLGKVLEDYGFRCSPIKFDGYLNVDAGTLNPYRHGEVFVLDDGLECDMDLGTYERFLEKNLSQMNYLTGGRIFTRVLGRERKGKYLGRDVQFIPHVTGDIKQFLRELAMKTKADVVLIEVGGTVGDIENQYFLEAMRQLAYEEGKGNSCFVNVTYVIDPSFLGEQKSKAAQLGIRRLMELGIQPDIIACRATKPVTKKVREKISIYSNVPFNNVVSLHDVDSVYEIPDMLVNANIHKSVMQIMGLEERASLKRDMAQKWRNYVKKLKSARKPVTIGITGKYTTIRDSYASILKALEHSATHLNVKARIEWIETTEIKTREDAKKALKGVDGVIVPGGFGKRGTEGKILCVSHLRENKIPYLGLCFGFQMAVIEFARNVCRLNDANSTEIEPKTPHPVIDILPEQKKIEGLGGNMRLGGRNIDVKKDSFAYKLYGNKTKVRERFRHRFECNPKYIKKLEKHGLVFSGKAPKHPIMQILELPNHPFFVGVQFHPEFTSRPLNPNPLYYGFMKAVVDRKK